MVTDRGILTETPVILAVCRQNLLDKLAKDLRESLAHRG
jgi:hypothetical protein